MRLIDLQIDGFGKLNGERIEFSEGTNLITGRNEAGKSTVYACIRAMFFGMKRDRGVAARTDTYSHYKPWFAKNYKAALRVEEGGHIYCIRRDFLRDPVSCTVYDETALEEVPFGDRFVAELLLGISEDIYDNTISINRLKADREGRLGSELKKYIVSMDTTGNRALNCARARAYLCDEKRSLTAGISPEAAKEYAVNCSEIKRLEETLREKAEETKKRAEAAAAAALAALEAARLAKEAERRREENAAKEQLAIQEEKEAREVLAVKAECAAKSAAAADEAARNRDAIETEKECLNAEIMAAREHLRKYSVHSSDQVAEARKEFDGKLRSYRKKSGKAVVIITRVLYILFFIFAIVDILAMAYALGNKNSGSVIAGCLVLEAAFLIMGIVFLVICIVAKNGYKNKASALGSILEKYTGYDEVTDERIDKVDALLADLKQEVDGAKEKESKLAELAKKAEELAAAANSSAEDARKAADEEKAARDAVAVAEGKVAAAAAVAAVKAVPVEGVPGETEKTQEAPGPDIEEINGYISKINELRTRNLVLKELLAKNDAIHEELDAIDLALEKLDELTDTMKDSLGVHLNARASAYIKEITGGAYDSLSVDDELNVFMNTKERMVPIEQVSNGTMDQIYMALRLAGARLVQNGEDKLPIIFDDSFVNYDDERLSSTLAWLVREYRGQVIIFSCQAREEELLKENSLTFNAIHL